MTRRTFNWLVVYNAGIGVAAGVLAYTNRDWTWFVPAIFGGLSAAIYCCPEPRMVGFMRFCPGWMSTRLGRRVATRVPFVQRRWQRNIDAALVAEAYRETIYRQAVLLMTLNKWMHASIVLGPDDVEQKGQVVAAWCSWRNAGERHHRYREEQAGKRLELPPWLEGMPRMEDLDFGAGTSAPH